MPYSLFLKYGSASYIYLDGDGITPPVQGAHYSPGLGRPGTWAGVEAITEEIKIDLAGTYRQIADWISLVNCQLETFKAGAWHDAVGGPLTISFIEPDQQTGYYWFSRIFDARLELDANGLAQRSAGQQSVSLWVTRENRWESTNTRSALAINFPGGGDQTTYAGLANHKDSTLGHSNWGWINPVSLEGDLLSHTSLQFMPGAGDFVGDVLIGLGWSDVPAPNVQYALPTMEETFFSAAAGVTKTSFASAACSGGNYAVFAWNTVVETLLMTAAIPSTLYSYRLAFERPFKPICRLQAAWAVTDCWFKAKILLGGTAAVVYETEWFLFPGGTQLLEFPPVYLPPAGMEETLQLDIAVYALKATPGVYSLPFDYMQLWPVDGGFRKYKQLAYFGSAGQMIDSGLWGSVYWSNYSLTQIRASVVAYGPPLQLLPGRTNVLAMANLTNGASWLIDDRITLLVNQWPTKRNI